MTPAHSSQDFVRALKSVSDPPVIGGLLKIEIAQQAWDDTSFYVPSKAEVIADWILTKLVKDKGKDSSSNPVLDTRYWRLISTLTASQDVPQKQRNESRPFRNWLTTILHRLPFGNVVVVFLKLFNDVPSAEKQELSNVVSSCLATIWPLSVQRMNHELLQECFGVLISTLSSSADYEGIVKIGRLISNSYRNALHNSSNKKKLHLSFLHSHLRPWLYFIAEDIPILETALKSSILDAGIDTLFNLDVLRQDQDSRAENAFLVQLRSLKSGDGDVILKTIPQIFMHYVHSLKRHRGAIFGQGSQQAPGAALEEFHDAAMQFFVWCEGIIQSYEQIRLAWEARSSLLKIVHQENIFHRKQVDAQVAFNEIVEVALAVSKENREDGQSEISSLAFQCLSAIAHIDYDLVLANIPRILNCLIQCPEPSEPHFAFLDILLDYHTKTRTMNVFLESIFASLSANVAFSTTVQERYQTTLSSPIMHTLFLSRLSKSMQNFSTPTQCLSVVNLVFDNLKNVWEQYNGVSRQLIPKQVVSSQEKRQTPAVGEGEPGEFAVIYSSVARLASVILSSLPIQSLPPTTVEEVRGSLFEFRTAFVHHTISKCLKTVKKKSSVDLWATEVVLAATMRLLYAINISKSLSLAPHHDTKLLGKISDTLDNDDLLPELILELFRTLLYDLSLGNVGDAEHLMGRLLTYIESNYTSKNVQWSGHVHHLTKGESGRAKCALAVMQMALERWLPVIDQLSTQEQLTSLLKVVLAVDVTPAAAPEKGLQSEQLWLQNLRSAQFWEFRNIRTAFLDFLDEITAPLDPSNPKQPKVSLILEVVKIYRLLLFLPPEYFSWQTFSNLIKRGLAADLALGRLPISQNQAVPEALIVLRVFLKRAYVHSGSVSQESDEESSEFLSHLLKEPHSLSHSIKEDFFRATLDLTEIYFTKLLKASSKSGSTPMLTVLSFYSPGLFANSPGIRARSFMELVDLLTREFTEQRMSRDIIDVLRTLHKDESTSLLPHITSITEHGISSGDIAQSSDLVSGWYSLLCLNKWLCPNPRSDTSIPYVGEKLATGLISPQKSGEGNELNDLRVFVFAIVLQELETRTEDERPRHLDFLVANYISFLDTLQPKGQTQLALYLGRSCKVMSLSDFVYLSSLVSDSLADYEHLSTSQVVHLVHLAALLLREHPSHTLKHVQKFATCCINVFSGNDIFIHGPPQLRLQVLELVAQHCSNQQAALRSLDTAGIWLLISKFLTPSKIHDECTEVAILHKIIAILTSLIRLRRDLVASALPHLGMIFRKLLLSTRGCRPHLGAKQTALVMNTQPRWISASRPLGPDEAKALGRLLESLNTKTTVRILSSSANDNQKAESLAKPFSKHAAYVLQAYIEAMNDTLCILPLEVRKELEPGLFALCGMMSDHSRDAMMVSVLDAGGKTTMKALWKEYEKQRYVGKG
ncbi:Urb2/Npa2 family-domain-containing protein [Crassisporium funariophilum]|nr:Urb2/Npa2 family-domain-containing protein [Crassisporium funariophilum]